jgi:hypothetical protein
MVNLGESNMTRSLLAGGLLLAAAFASTEVRALTTSKGEQNSVGQPAADVLIVQAGSGSDTGSSGGTGGTDKTRGDKTRGGESGTGTGIGSPGNPPGAETSAPSEKKPGEPGEYTPQTPGAPGTGLRSPGTESQGGNVRPEK